MSSTTTFITTSLGGTKRKKLSLDVVKTNEVADEPFTGGCPSGDTAKRAKMSTEPENEYVIKADKPVVHHSIPVPNTKPSSGKRPVQYDARTKISREILGLADEVEDDPEYVTPIDNEAMFEEDISANPDKWERDDEQEVIYVTKSLKARDGRLFIQERRPLNARLCNAPGNRLNFDPDVQSESWEADLSTYRNPIPEGLYMTNKQYQELAWNMMSDKEASTKQMKKKGAGVSPAGKKQENYLAIDTMSLDHPDNDKAFGAKVVQAAVNMGFISSKQDFFRQLADIQEFKDNARRARENKAAGLLAMAENSLLNPDAAGIGKDNTNARMEAAERRKKRRRYAYMEQNEYTKNLNAAKHIADVQEFNGKIGKSSSSRYAQGGGRGGGRSRARRNKSRR